MSTRLDNLPLRGAFLTTDLLYVRSATGLNYRVTWQNILDGIPAVVAPVWGNITGVLAAQLDLNAALNLKAPLASPGLTGVPLSTTAAVDTNTTQIATTAYVIGQGYLKSATAAATYAPLASPGLTGVPLSTTAAVDTNTTQIATTAFVIGQGYAKLVSPTFTGTPAAPTAATGTNTTQLATTAFVQATSTYGLYKTILLASSSHTAAVAAGTYALANGNASAVSGTGTLYPLSIIRIRSTDYPNVDGKTAKFRISAQIYVNDVAPTGNFTFGLYPVTTPATSGGAGLRIYTMGTVVGSSTILFTTPAADGQLNGTSADFALPADGDYVIGVITTAAVAASSHLHLNASLQTRHT